MKTGRSANIVITGIPEHVEDNNGEALIRELAEFINNQETCDDGLTIVFSLMMSAVMFGRSCNDMNIEDMKEGLHKALDGCIDHTVEVPAGTVPPSNSVGIH